MASRHPVRSNSAKDPNMNLAARIRFTLDARNTDRSLAFLLATWRNTSADQNNV